MKRFLTRTLAAIFVAGGLWTLVAPARADVEERTAGEIDRAVLEWLDEWVAQGENPSRSEGHAAPVQPVLPRAISISEAEAVCFPTCTVDDGRMLTVLGGSELESFVGSRLAFRLSAPASATVLRWGVFDGDSQGTWDFPADATSLLELNVYPDPDGAQDPQSPAGTPVQAVLGSAMDDDAWSDFEIDLTATPEAQTSGPNASGDYVFLVTAELTGAATGRDWNNFKLRSDRRLRIVTEPFAFTAPLFGAEEGPILYPNGPGDPGTTTYDGTWSLYLEQKTATPSITVWDGDFDRGSWDGSHLDSDDPGTPNSVPAFAAGTNAQPEGVADGSQATCTTESSATGCPADDRSIALFRRSASVASGMTGAAFPAPGPDSFLVPAGIDEITVKLWGAGGAGGAGGDGSAGGDGGGGGFAQCTVAVTPGETLDVQVGGGGEGGSPGSAAGEGGGGGGRSELSRAGTALCVAGAGGGGGGGDDDGGNGGGDGGPGGGTAGQAGECTGSAAGGQGGTQIAGGSGGAGNRQGGQAGGLEAGGDGGAGGGGAGGLSAGGDGGEEGWLFFFPFFFDWSAGAGGGGSGLYGGGGGGTSAFGSNGAAGGAGGSSFLSGSATSTTAGSGLAPGNGGDPDYAAGAGVGGDGGGVGAAGEDGGDGRVVLAWSAGSETSPVRYTVTAPDGQTTTRDDPSGNREWERLDFATGDGEDFPPGVFLVRAEGVDLSNLNAWKFENDVCPVNAAGEAVCSLCLDTIDFETDAEGNPLAEGEVLDEQWAAWGVHITTVSNPSNEAMVYDTACPGGCSGGDLDLGTPNECYGGPGVAGGPSPSDPGGPCGSGATNDAPLGNVMIISEDGDSNDPDDDAGGGEVIWTFDYPVYVDHIELLDLETTETARVFFYDQFGNDLLFDGANDPGLPLLGGGDNSFATADSKVGGVRRLVFDFSGSGAIPALTFCLDKVVDSQPEPSGAISGLVFRDSDGDGSLDRQAGELALSGAAVEVRAGADVVSSTTSGAGGEYRLEGLPADVYRVGLAGTGGGAASEEVVFLGEDEEVDGIDLGAVPGAPVPPLSAQAWSGRPWPVSALTLGGQVYGRGDLVALMSRPGRLRLSHDLVREAAAAKLNVGNGVASGCVEPILAEADGWIEDEYDPAARGWRAALDFEGRAIARALEAFNLRGCS